MLFPSATVAAAIVLSLVGPSPLEARTEARAPAASSITPSGVSPAVKLAAGLWAPKKAAKPRPARNDDEREEELLKPRAPTNGGGDAASRTAKRRPIKMDDGAEEGDDESEEGEDEDDEDRPKVVKKRKRVAEEEQDVEEPLDSQPSVIPRLVNVGVGVAMIRRSFAYDQPLQGDKGFRPGFQLALESYPFVNRPSGAYRTLGLGVYYEKQYGTATHESPMTGEFSGYGFSQSRWGFDVRWGIPAGQWVMIMPALGYGRASADLDQRGQPTVPSNCTATSTMVCFGDANAAYLSADLHLRVGLTPTFAMSLAGGYLLGLGVGKGTDQITSEANASMKGFHLELGALLLLGDNLALQATVPIRRYVYVFDAAGGSVTYRSATDLYYGLVAGVAIFTR
jgi:hypothetical protein